uniref:Boophilin-G2-like n=1 Tax=Sinocyclocheilus grahami TaxID=75366 RepID=A0A672NNN2_SINGR
MSHLSFSGPGCTEPRDEGEGTAKLLKFFYDPQLHNCVPFFYKGGGGNSNCFNSDKDCVKACLPKADEIYPDEGTDGCFMLFPSCTCFAIIPMYYYDNEEKICRMFLYGGCRGNGNRFDSREDCQNMCLGQFKSHFFISCWCLYNRLNFGYIKRGFSLKIANSWWL